MKLAPSGLGAEPKKLMLLGGLVVVLGIVYWTQDRSNSPAQAVSTTAAPQEAIPPVRQLPPRPKPEGEAELPALDVPADGIGSQPAARRAPIGSNSGNDTFIPSMKPKEDLDVSKIDPRIRLDLLAKVRAVPLEGGSSSLFDFSKAPEPPAPRVAAIVPVPVPPPAPKPVTPPPAPKPAGPPPAPPIPFKYYGYAGKTTDQGFFLEGDPTTGSIYVKREGDTIKDRYKIIRIGLRSAVVEDTVSHNQETLKLPEDQQ